VITEKLLQLLPVYVLVLFRVAAMMVFAPLLGSARIPKRLKALIACVLAFALAPAVAPPAALPANSWELAVGIGGEIVFGLAMGMILSFAFIAAQWAGEMIGQQMGLNLSETFDPQFGAQGSVIGDMYYMLTLVVFIAVDGHVAMIRGISNSFASLPLLSIGMNRPLLGTLVGLFQASTSLAVQLAAPVLVTLLVVDLSLGFIGKTVPQMNVMTAGVTLRSVVGLLVVILGIGLSSRVIGNALVLAMQRVFDGFSRGAV